MSIARTFHGYVYRRENLNKGLGSHRRPVLIVELTTDEAGALDEAIANEPLRGKGIPITFVLADAAEGVAAIRDELRPSPPTTGSGVKPAALPPTPFQEAALGMLLDIRDSVASIEASTKQVADNTKRLIGK